MGEWRQCVHFDCSIWLRSAVCRAWPEARQAGNAKCQHQERGEGYARSHIHMGKERYRHQRPQKDARATERCAKAKDLAKLASGKIGLEQRREWDIAH